MLTRLRFHTALLAPLSALAPAAHAQGSQAGEGFYLSGNLGQSHFKDRSPLSAAIDKSD